MEETLKLILEKLNKIDTDIIDLKLGQERLTKNYDGLIKGQDDLTKNYDRLSKGQDELIKNYDRLSKGQDELVKGHSDLKERLEAFERQTMKRFNEVDKKIDSLSNAVADLMEFRTEAENRFANIE